MRANGYNSYDRQGSIDPAIIECQRNLPVYAYRNQIVEQVKKKKIVLIVGETGSGKTTQIPQYLLNWKKISPFSAIVCTQPRKVAAQSVARRVADEVGENKPGETIGYHVRLDCKVDPQKTKLVYMTEGVLLRKAMSCDNLANYKVVIIDEAHERTVNADLLMGFLKKMVVARNKTNNELHVIIMSATLDTERFKKYFGVLDSDIIKVPGSANPVQHHWCKAPTDDYKQLSIDLILAIHNNGYERRNNDIIPDGHILVFLTGRKDIDEVVKEVEERSKNRVNDHGFSLEVYALYSQLPPEKQKFAFKEPDSKKTRKCVVATNIAETSLTIDNVVYVIDCGLSKQKMYSPSKGLEVLAVRGISKASVQQRIGRAGRVRPGVAYHLYTQDGYENLQNETPAEILRSGLVNEMLSMLALGIENPLKFDFIDAPNEMTMARALHILKNLNAINDEGKITEIGKQMAAFPVNPRMAKSIVAAMNEYNCVYEVIVIAAMLEIEDRLWIKPFDIDKKGLAKKKKKEFYHASGDHLTLLNVFNAFMAVSPSRRRSFCESNFLNYGKLDRAERIRQQIEKVASNVWKEANEHKEEYNDYYGAHERPAMFKINGIESEGYYENIIKALLSGHFMNIAVKGFGDNYWRFRLLDLDDKNKAIDIVDKAKCHQNSMFDKNGAMNWVIYGDVSISHTTQLKILTAIKPKWLIEIESNSYYKLKALQNDQTPIAQILKSYDALQ